MSHIYLEPPKQSDTLGRTTWLQTSSPHIRILLGFVPFRNQELFLFCLVSCVLCSSAASGVSGATEELSRPAAEAQMGTSLKELFTQLHRLLMLEGNPVEQSGLVSQVPS